MAVIFGLTQVCTDFKDPSKLLVECQQGASFGFTGKQAVHPNQIAVINEAFSPSQETISAAERMLNKYMDESRQGNRGSFEFEGKMIDKPVISKAIRVLQSAIRYNLVSNPENLTVLVETYLSWNAQEDISYEHEE